MNYIYIYNYIYFTQKLSLLIKNQFKKYFKEINPYFTSRFLLTFIFIKRKSRMKRIYFIFFIYSLIKNKASFI